MNHQFAGTGVALVTPFSSNGSINYTELENLVDHVINNGVSYIVALGTTAETPTLSSEEKLDVLKCIINKCNKRVPVVCGVGGNNTMEVVHQLGSLPAGVDGILSVSPYYNKPSQEGIYQHFKAIAQATDMPIILYNVPGRTSSNMLPATTLRLANDFKNIVAIKEASGNLAQCMELVQGRPAHFAILSGDDDLILPQVAIGMHGVISVAANCFTKDFTEMVRLALANDYEASRKLHYKLIEGIRLLFVEGNPAGVKCVLKNMRLSSNYLRLPIVPCTEATEAKIKAYLNTL